MSPIVCIPSSVSLADVFGPTPHSMSAGSGATKAASSPAGTIVRPKGGPFPLPAFLPTSVAIFATSLLEAIPIEDGNPISSRMLV